MLSAPPAAPSPMLAFKILASDMGAEARGARAKIMILTFFIGIFHFVFFYLTKKFVLKTLKVINTLKLKRSLKVEECE